MSKGEKVKKLCALGVLGAMIGLAIWLLCIDVQNVKEGWENRSEDIQEVWVKKNGLYVSTDVQTRVLYLSDVTVVRKKTVETAKMTYKKKGDKEKGYRLVLGEEQARELSKEFAEKRGYTMDVVPE